MLQLFMSPRVEDNGSGNQFVWGKEKTGRWHLNRGELNVFVQLLSYFDICEQICRNHPYRVTTAFPKLLILYI
jgi:hypothetical protein